MTVNQSYILVSDSPNRQPNNVTTATATAKSRRLIPLCVLNGHNRSAQPLYLSSTRHKPINLSLISVYGVFDISL